MNTFIKMRLNPVLDSTPYYRSIIDPNVNSVENKKIRDAFLSFRTSSKSGAVEGLDVDYVALDEYDRVSPSASQSAQQSLSSSAFKMFRRFSTPTSPGTGIDDLFEHSDQRVYMHKCTHCGYWNEMRYADYNPTHLDSSGNILMLNKDGVDYRAQTIVPGTYQFVCQKCGQPLDRWYNGQFVAKFPERSTNAEDGIRGYRISQMNAVWVD